MSLEPFGSTLLVALPDDVLTIVTRSLSPRDICNLALCCRSLHDLVASEKIWLTQCDMVGIVPHHELIQWRNAVSSYKALCSFLFTVKPLMGIWVHQNPELGNVVYVMPGFVSVVGCRIIPQELGPLGEGCLKRHVGRTSSGLSRSQRVYSQFEASVAFSRLGFSDRRSLLEVITGQVSLKLSAQLPPDPTQLELSDIKKTLERSSGLHYSTSEDDGHSQSNKKKTLGRYFRDSINQILGKSNGGLAASKNGSSSSDSKHAQLSEFLRSGDTIGLTLAASAMKLSSYSVANMHDSRYALYKLPLAFQLLTKSMQESQGQRLLIATKILEGTHYVLHPNGSAMFMEGIANGYGFRYPGSKPGSLFVFENGHLAFIWKETKAVLTLQRLNLQELLKKGEKVHALPPTANFSYLTKSYSNVFAGFPNSSSCLYSSQRQRR
uniref:F-box domain-containing protein n=1 Tax=Cannabis sativa TaxID=3483 RepID=A0A803P7G1_CANSA